MELSEDARAALAVLRKSMRPACFIRNIDFRYMLKEHELDNRASLVEAVDLVVIDPPYSMRRVVEERQ